MASRLEKDLAQLFRIDVNESVLTVVDRAQLALLVDVAQSLREIREHATVAYVPADVDQAEEPAAAEAAQDAAEEPRGWPYCERCDSWHPDRPEYRPYHEAHDLHLARIAYAAYTAEIPPLVSWPLVPVPWEDAKPLTRACWLAAARAIRDALVQPS